MWLLVCSCYNKCIKQSDHSYSPAQIGISNGFKKFVSYREFDVPREQRHTVHCLWALESQGILKEEFEYVVMPDACIDIIFDAKQSAPALVMTPTVGIEKINLGRQFRYVGIRLEPGVLSVSSLDLGDVIGQQRYFDKLEDLVMKPYTKRIVGVRDDECISILQDLIMQLHDLQYIKQNKFVSSVLLGFQFGMSQDEIAKKSGYSTRQLRRKIVEQTGFTPVQLYRIFRFQSVLSRNDAELRFADQSHLIKEFKKITGTSFKSFIDSY